MNLKNVLHFKRNDILSKEEIKKQLKEIEKNLLDCVSLKMCPVDTCKNCVFKNISENGGCLPDCFSDEDNNYPHKNMYGRFFKSLSYYREKFIKKNSYIQEEMEI